MNHKLGLALIYTLGAIAMAFIIGAATQERIRWKWHDKPILQIKDQEGGLLEIGLDPNGHVLWREILPVTTNSQAEQAEPWGTMTNVMMTNWLKPDWTNIYVPPRDHPEWTNWEEGAR